VAHNPFNPHDIAHRQAADASRVAAQRAQEFARQASDRAAENSRMFAEQSRRAAFWRRSRSTTNSDPSSPRRRLAAWIGFVFFLVGLALILLMAFRLFGV